METQRVRNYLDQWDRGKDVQIKEDSTATVELAAKAFNVEPGRIAKSLSFKLQDSPIVIVTAGDTRVNNKKYKEQLGKRAKMLKPEEVKEKLGYEIGGVCPFDLENKADVYLDESLKKYESVFPACGSANSAIELTLSELELYSKAKGWINIGND